MVDHVPWVNFVLKRGSDDHTYPGLITYTSEGPHMPWTDHMYPRVTTQSLEWPHIPWSDHTYLGVTTHTLEWPHIPWSDHTYLGVTTHTLEWPHIPWSDHTYLGVTTHTLEWPHIPWSDHTYLGVTTHTLEWPHIPWSDHTGGAGSGYWAGGSSAAAGRRLGENGTFGRAAACPVAPPAPGTGGHTVAVATHKQTIQPPQQYYWNSKCNVYVGVCTLRVQHAYTMCTPHVQHMHE